MNPEPSPYSPKILPQILIVDDTPANLKVLSTMLRGEGFKVRNALEGESALEAALSSPPDLILLDVMMPGLSGYEVCQRLKADPLTARVPVIFISALDDALDKVRAFQVGGVDYIAKPFQLEEVLIRVRSHLTLDRQRREIEALNSHLLLKNAQLEREIRERQIAETELQQANEELERLSLLDSLTHLANRRRFDAYIEEQWQSLGRARLPLGLIMADVDFFKRFNDHFGHPAGDECLRRVAQALRLGVHRSADLIARYGGEEFAVILPMVNELGLKTVMESVHGQIAQLGLLHPASSVAPTLTLSLGAAVLIPGPESTVADLIESADAALYQAKQRGRNQSVLAPSRSSGEGVGQAK